MGTKKTATPETAITAEFLAEQKKTINTLIQRLETDLEVFGDNIKNPETPSETRVENKQEEPKKIEKIGLLKKALERIEYNNYGKCHGCGEEIQTNRLKALPTTEHCTSCAK